MRRGTGAHLAATILAGLLLALIATASPATAQEQEQEQEQEADESQFETNEDPEVRAALEEVLARPEFRKLHRRRRTGEESGELELPQWLEDFLDWLFGIETGDTPSAGFLRPLIFIGAALFLAVVLFLIVRAVVRDRVLVEAPGEGSGIEGFSPDLPPGEHPAAHYLERALRLAEQGELRPAIRELVLGAMSWTERSGFLRHRKGLTNRDYIRALRRRPDQRDSLSAMTLVFYEVYFGRREATPERFESCLADFRNGFGHGEEGAHAS